jgi:hypothetical protein
MHSDHETLLHKAAAIYSFDQTILSPAPENQRYKPYDGNVCIITGATVNFSSL